MAGPIWKDSVVETSTTTGTGAFTLAGALTGFRTFDSVMSIGDELWYLIEAVDGSGNRTGEWETGWGTYSASGELTRTVVKDGSNGSSAVNFSAGTKRVMISLSADAFTYKGCQLKKSADQTSANFTTATALSWDSESGGYDTHGFHDNVTNNSRITLPGPSVLTAKKIRLRCQVELANVTADLWVRLMIYQDGAANYLGAGKTAQEIGTTNPFVQTMTGVFTPASETSYYEAFLQVETDTIIDIESDLSSFELEVIE